LKAVPNSTKARSRTSTASTLPPVHPTVAEIAAEAVPVAVVVVVVTVDAATAAAVVRVATAEAVTRSLAHSANRFHCEASGICFFVEQRRFLTAPRNDTAYPRDFHEALKSFELSVPPAESNSLENSHV
jgi:hypothetical protein